MVFLQVFLLIIYLKLISQCLLQVCLTHTFSLPTHTIHILYSLTRFYSAIIVRPQNTSGPLKGWSKSSSRENRRVKRVRNTRHVFVTIEKQIKKKDSLLLTWISSCSLSSVENSTLWSFIIITSSLSYDFLHLPPTFALLPKNKGEGASTKANVKALSITEI